VDLGPLILENHDIWHHPKVNIDEKLVSIWNKVLPLAVNKSLDLLMQRCAFLGSLSLS
jgi:hypothetical protein